MPRVGTPAPEVQRLGYTAQCLRDSGAGRAPHLLHLWCWCAYLLGAPPTGGTHLESNAPPGPSYSLKSQPVFLDSHCFSVLLIASGR